MATYIRTLARIATRASRPSNTFMARQAPAAMVARQYHAFRPTQIASKGKKHAVLDEDDEELEAELRELEREKQDLLDQTSSSRQRHELPRHSAIYHLTKVISNQEQAQQLPALVKQWRQKQLPISILVSAKIIHAVCKAHSPEIALELLGDRETFALSPGQSSMRRVVRSFVKEIQLAGQETEEALEKLDGAFKTMALIPYYNLAADDSSVYANLIRGSLLYGGEEGLRRASVTMDEYLLIDGEREKPLTRRRAAEMVAAAEKLNEAYEAKGEADKAKELKKHLAEWKKSL
ncbi:hypothetical protein BGX28_005892 [Mortierella sp. GBA30]|nr:hypothetical protein BGX28_005892 [Mortierella sp. GBA30]